jgi:hypothetical protein
MFKREQISHAEAMQNASSPENLQMMLRTAGATAARNQ